MDERIERARARLAEREQTLSDKDTAIAELEAALGAGSPIDRHRVRVKQLRAQIADVKREGDALRARIAARENRAPVVSTPAILQSPEEARMTGAIVGAVFLVGILAMVYCGR